MGSEFTFWPIALSTGVASPALMIADVQPSSSKFNGDLIYGVVILMVGSVIVSMLGTRSGRLSSPRQQSSTVRKLDHEFGFKQPWFVRFHWLIFGLILIVLTATAAVIGWWLYATTKEPSAFSSIGVGVAIAAASLTYTQWRAARRETSLERFYDRLQSTNDQLAKWPYAIAMQWDFVVDEQKCLPQADEEMWQKEMYVFTEIDNLEYAIEKYWIGFMSTESAMRAAHTFRHRCSVPDFQTTVMRIVQERKNRQIMDYTVRTLEAAEKICAQVPKK